MKKTTAALLIIALFATCLSGCGSKAEVEFGASVNKFMNEVSINTGAIYPFCYFESERLRADGIGAEEMDEAYFNYCADAYAAQLSKAKLEGDDISDMSLQEMIDRANWVQEEYKRIKATKVKAENFDELQAAVDQAYEAHQRLLALSTTLRGPADDFLEEAGDLLIAASTARQDAIDLLQPYYQKPGYAKLINK